MKQTGFKTWYSDSVSLFTVLLEVNYLQNADEATNLQSLFTRSFEEKSLSMSSNLSSTSLSLSHQGNDSFSGKERETGK